MIAFKIRLFYLLHCNTNITAFHGHILKMHSYNGRLNIALEIFMNHAFKTIIQTILMSHVLC